MKKIILLFFILHIIIGSSIAQLVDIDENVYKTVKIGDQTWMAENLYVTHFRNGDLIPVAKTREEWERFGKEKKPGKLETDSPDKKQTLYNWYAVNDPRGLAPLGWHIPDSVEWAILIKTAGGRKNLKSTSGWRKDGNGTNLSGFDAKPTTESCDCGWWWTASEIETINSYPRVYAHIIEISWCSGCGSEEAANDCYIPNPVKSFEFAVRCVKDVKE